MDGLNSTGSCTVCVRRGCVPASLFALSSARHLYLCVLSFIALAPIGLCYARYSFSSVGHSFFRCGNASRSSNFLISPFNRSSHPPTCLRFPCRLVVPRSSLTQNYSGLSHDRIIVRIGLGIIDYVRHDPNKTYGIRSNPRDRLLRRRHLFHVNTRR